MKTPKLDRNPMRQNHRMSKFCELARVILATAIWVCSSGNMEAAGNVVVWDTHVILGNNVDLEERTAWKRVPSDLLSLEADPKKAASDPVVFCTKVEEGGKGYFSRCGALYERHSSK